MNQILQFLKKSPVCWYPGCGSDLVPLLLMHPKRHNFGQSMSDLSSSENRDLVMWFLDQKEVVNPSDLFCGERAYGDLWSRFDSDYRVMDIEELDKESSIPNFRHFLITVEIERGEAHQICKFLYTSGDALSTFRQFVIPNSLNLIWVVLMRFGAMSGTIGELPGQFHQLSEGHPCLPDLFVSDRDWSQSALPNYERLGSRDAKWGEPNRVRVRGGGIRGWGWRCSSNWVKADRYADYYSFLEPAK
jgi:hypothetical protein